MFTNWIRIEEISNETELIITIEKKKKKELY